VLLESGRKLFQSWTRGVVDIVPKGQEMHHRQQPGDQVHDVNMDFANTWLLTQRTMILPQMRKW